LTDAGFSTFSHISQYGENSYQDLPRMLAMSRLCLWSPSSLILKSKDSGLSPEEFLRYLDMGEIRIFGRHRWINEPAWRNKQPWAGAAWDDNIDGRIQKICAEDSSLPKAQRRVVVAPPEKGDVWAEQYLEQNPQQIKTWSNILKRASARQQIPGGSLEYALRNIDHPRTAVLRILRDACNHGQAIAFAEVDAPFLTNGVHNKFLRTLAEAPVWHEDDDEDLLARLPDKPDATAEVDTGLGHLLAQMSEILNQLNSSAGAAGDPQALDKFMRGTGRPELMQWMSSLCRLLARQKVKDLNGKLLAELQTQLDESRYPGLLETWLSRKDETAVGLVGLVSTIISTVTDPSGMAAPDIASAGMIMGILASAYPMGKGLARQLGYAPAEFTGPQWPFLYTYGKRARKKQLQEISDALKKIGSPEPGRSPAAS
jgi:hypothetical protein